MSGPKKLQILDRLGRTSTLVVRRIEGPGAFLAVDPEDFHPRAPVILLPGQQIPKDARVGSEISVFVYLDSEDRPVATTAAPHLELGEVAFVKIVDVNQIGAFADWGLAKDLFLPFAQQTRDLVVGDCEPVGLDIDNTGRLLGTMRIRELLTSVGEFQKGEWVHGEAWRNDPDLGVFVIVERRFIGLVPRHEPHQLQRGQSAKFRVTHVHADGKIELSTRGQVHEELANDADLVFGRIDQAGTPRVSDRSSPQQIQSLFGLSKKAFKRAVGRLLKEGKVVLAADGSVLPQKKA